MNHERVSFQRTNTILNRKYREFLIPTLLNNTALSLSAVVDNILAGNLVGDEALAALGVAFPLIAAINMIALIFIVGGVISASAAAGAQNMSSANRFFTISIFSGMASLVFYGIVVNVFVNPISLALSNGDMQLAGLVGDYIRPVAVGACIIYLTNCLSQFALAEGRVKMSVTFLLVANIADLTLGYVFMGPLKMGITGAGLSTALGYVLGFACTIPYLTSKTRMFHFAFSLESIGKKLLEVIRSGLSPFMEQGATLVKTVVLNFIVLMSLGVKGMTALAVIVTAQNIIQIVLDGTSNALNPIISSLAGEGDIFGIKNVTKSALKILLGACLFTTLLFLIFPSQVVRVFGISRESTADMAMLAIMLYAASFIFYGINNAMQNIYNALGRNSISTYIAFMENSGFVIAFAFLLMQVAPNLIWLAYLGAELATIVSIAVYIRIVQNKEPVKGILLLEEENHETDLVAVWDTTIPTDIEAAMKLSEQVIAFCKDYEVDSALASRVGIAVEEMAVNIVRYGNAGKHHNVIDILIKISVDKLMIRIRDDGIIFDPTSVRDDTAQAVVYHGLDVVKKLAEAITYSRALGLNNTVITFNLQAAKT
jgi:Na+-driven multidrug efflux pump/anti-sigma regulatory factor (Ser/Thr protein kinase)